MRNWLWIFSFFFFWFFLFSDGIAQNLPWQPDLNGLMPIKQNAEGRRIKTEKRYLKLKKRLLPLQQCNYNKDGRLLFTLNYCYDSLTHNTSLKDSISYQYLPTVNEEPDVKKIYYLWQQNKWEFLKNEFQVYTQDTVYLKVLAPKGDTLQLLKIVRDSTGLPLRGLGITNIKQPNNNGYFYFNYKGLLNVNAFFYPTRRVIKYKRKPGPPIPGVIPVEVTDHHPLHFENVNGFVTVFQQQYNKKGNPLNIVVNQKSERYSHVPGRGRSTVITLESYFKYRMNGKLAYQLDYIVPHYFGNGREIGKYSPKVLLFFKITEKKLKDQETEQRLYPLKRTNRVLPTSSYVLNTTIHTANLSKVGFRRTGRPIIILKQYSFY